MLVSKYDDSRLLLALQIDHSRVAGYLAAHGATTYSRNLDLTVLWCWQPKSTTTDGGNGKSNRLSTTGVILSITSRTAA
jgi:hypothetical protein